MTSEIIYAALKAAKSKAPKAKAEKPAAKVKAPAKAKAAKVVTPKAPKAAKAPAVEQNGIRRPKAGGLCAQAWDVFEQLAKSGVVTLSAARIAGKAKGLNEGNLTTELPRWRKFNGIAKPAKAAAA